MGSSACFPGAIAWWPSRLVGAAVSGESCKCVVYIYELGERKTIRGSHGAICNDSRGYLAASNRFRTFFPLSLKRSFYFYSLCKRYHIRKSSMLGLDLFYELWMRVGIKAQKFIALLFHINE